MLKTIFLILLCTNMINLIACLDSCAAKERASLKADRVLVKKSARRLFLLKNGKIVKEYKIALGNNPKGHKERQGDGRTPEGCYLIDSRNARSQFHRSLHISYPNTKDRKVAKQKGVSPGDNIMIHGLPNGYKAVGPFIQFVDWTLGCIAVTNREIEEIWRAVPNGTPICIEP